MKIDIGISSENLKKINAILNVVLANGNLMYIKLRKFHWNVKGNDFMQYHLLFEEQYTAIETAIDEVAERISTLGGIAIGTFSEFIKYAELTENPGKNPEPKEMLAEIVKDHETIIKSLRKSIDECDENYRDTGTADLLTGLMTDHEKMAWKIRQYLH